MIENRRFYRLPSHSRFTLGTQTKVYSGKSVNVSMGGAFVQILDIKGVQSGDRLRCDFMLTDASPVLSGIVTVKRVSNGSSNPADASGLGIEFTEFSNEAMRLIEEFVLEQKRIYEILGTLLMTTEPDLRSMRPLLAKLPVQLRPDLRDLRIFVESTLRSIQLVENKRGQEIPPL